MVSVQEALYLIQENVSLNEIIEIELDQSLSLLWNSKLGKISPAPIFLYFHGYNLLACYSLSIHPLQRSTAFCQPAYLFSRVWLSI